MSQLTKLYASLAGLDQIGCSRFAEDHSCPALDRGLKFAKYEGEGIVPLVSNSPLMAFFYRFRAPASRTHMNKEGDLSQSSLSSRRAPAPQTAWSVGGC